MSVVGFYTKDGKRRPITARKSTRQRRRLTSARLLGYHVEYEDTKHSRIVTCHFRVGTRYVKATNEFELGKNMESEFIARPVWHVDPKSFASALRGLRAEDLSHFRFSDERDPDRSFTRRDLKDLITYIGIASKFRNERPEITYDAAYRRVGIFFPEPTSLGDIGRVKELREKEGIDYRRRYFTLVPLTSFAWQQPSRKFHLDLE